MEKLSKKEKVDIVFDEGREILKERVRKVNATKRRVNALYYLGYIGEIGFVIAIPIAGGILLGSYLDHRWGTYPKFTLGLLFLGLIVSVVNFVHVIKDIIKKS